MTNVYCRNFMEQMYSTEREIVGPFLIKPSLKTLVGKNKSQKPQTFNRPLF